MRYIALHGMPLGIGPLKVTSIAFATCPEHVLIAYLKSEVILDAVCDEVTGMTTTVVIFLLHYRIRKISGQRRGSH